MMDEKILTSTNIKPKQQYSKKKHGRYTKLGLVIFDTRHIHQHADKTSKIDCGSPEGKPQAPRRILPWFNDTEIELNRIIFTVKRKVSEQHRLKTDTLGWHFVLDTDPNTLT